MDLFVKLFVVNIDRCDRCRSELNFLVPLAGGKFQLPFEEQILRNGDG